jgi:hypothetical protein
VWANGKPTNENSFLKKNRGNFDIDKSSILGFFLKKTFALFSLTFSLGLTAYQQNKLRKF